MNLAMSIDLQKVRCQTVRVTERWQAGRTIKATISVCAAGGCWTVLQSNNSFGLLESCGEFEVRSLRDILVGGD